MHWSVLSRYLITNLAEKVICKCSTRGLVLSWNTTVHHERMLRPCRTRQNNGDASIPLLSEDDLNSSKYLIASRIAAALVHITVVQGMTMYCPLIATSHTNALRTRESGIFFLNSPRSARPIISEPVSCKRRDSLI